MLRVLALIPLLLLTACSAGPAPRVGQPTATVGERTDAGVVVNFTIPCENPSSEGLPLREVRYTVSIDGRPVFRGLRSPEATVRRFGTQEIHLPAVLAAEPGQSLPTGTSTFKIDAEMLYVRPGILSQALFDAELVQPSVDFSGSGTIDFGK